MTFQTAGFLQDKKQGKVEKAGYAYFRNGRTYTERVLWYDSNGGDYYVILNKEAELFHFYSQNCYSYAQLEYHCPCDPEITDTAFGFI